jgi:hypothetical protein
LGKYTKKVFRDLDKDRDKNEKTDLKVYCCAGFAGFAGFVGLWPTLLVVFGKIEGRLGVGAGSLEHEGRS